MRPGASSPPCVSPRPSALARYLEHLRSERRLAAHTLQAYRRDTEALLALCADRPLEALGPHDIRRHVATLHGRGLAPRSLARMLSSWRRLFEWLVREGSARANPCDGVKPPRAPKRLPEVLSPDQAVMLVSREVTAPLDVRDRALFEL